MGKYYPVDVVLSFNQAQKLKRMNPIRLLPNQFGIHASKHPEARVIHLTRSQIRRLHRASTKGKGSTIHMSGSQLKYSNQKGGGFLDDLGSYARKGVNFVKEKGLPLAKQLIKDKAIPLAVDYVKSKIGSGIRAPGQKGGRVQKGRGFFRNAFKSVARVAAPIVAPIAKQAANLVIDTALSKNPLLASTGLGDIAKGAVSSGIDRGAQQIGSGVKKGRIAKGPSPWGPNAYFKQGSGIRAPGS